VADPKHVSRFMRQHFATATQHEPGAIRHVFPGEAGS
jgi:hypothetical protein